MHSEQKRDKDYEEWKAGLSLVSSLVPEAVLPTELRGAGSYFNRVERYSFILSIPRDSLNCHRQEENLKRDGGSSNHIGFRQ